MRKITQDAVRAYNNNYNFKRSNTEVRVLKNDNGVIFETQLFLHGNCIAHKNKTGSFISSCGWHTTTTKERLNGLYGVHIYQKDWNWYLNGELWDGGRIRID
tara:strand:- start:4150 stop:4455 length:306 start_codon:yes stop_codon:yes gene_type:complete